MTKNRRFKRIAAAAIVFATCYSAQADYYRDGIRNYTGKNYVKAREYLLKAVETGDYGNAYYFLGEIERNANNFEDAEKYYECAVSSKTISRGYLKNAYWNLLAFAERVQDYGKVVKISRGMWLRLGDGSAKRKIDTIINKFLWTDNEPAIEKYRQGIRLKKEGDQGNALKAFSDALAADPGYLAPRFEIGMISYKKGDMDRALSNLETIAGKIVFYAEVHIILGEIYYNRGAYSRAITHLDKAQEYGIPDRATDYLIATKRGTCRFQTGDNENALEDFKSALSIDPTALQPMIMIAAVHIKENRYDDAMKMLNRANSAHQDNPVVLFQIGSIYYREDDARYVKYFDRTFDAIKNGGEYSEKYDRIVSLLLAEHYKNRDFSRVTEIISFVPGDRLNADNLLVAARTYFEIKDYDRSIDYFEKLSLSGEDSFTLSQAYARSGRKEKAKETLSRLIRDDRYLKKARSDRNLSPLVRELEASSKENNVP